MTRCRPSGPDRSSLCSQNNRSTRPTHPVPSRTRKPPPDGSGIALSVTTSLDVLVATPPPHPAASPNINRRHIRHILPLPYQAALRHKSANPAATPRHDSRRSSNATRLPCPGGRSLLTRAAGPILRQSHSRAHATRFSWARDSALLECQPGRLPKRTRSRRSEHSSPRTQPSADLARRRPCCPGEALLLRERSPRLRPAFRAPPGQTTRLA
jgi:hypothetical protein